MSLWRREIKASDIELVQTAETFRDSREPAMRIGDFVKLNSGGPVMMVVDRPDERVALVAWKDRAAQVHERSFAVPCVHRVSPASEGSAGPAV